MADLYIDGEWVPAAAGGRRDVVNPFDASVVRSVDEADAADVDRAVRAAARAFREEDWARAPVRRRADVLFRVSELLRRDVEDIARTETLDTGKTLTEARIDVEDVAAAFRYFAEIAGKDGGRVVDVGPGVLSRVVYEPIGVCALIAPWNYPLLQASWKVAPALAAGNTFVLKPSETTPLSTLALIRLIEEAGAPRGVANLVLGSGATAGAAMTAHPDVDLVSFTGGLATGRRIMASAAEGVKNIALELGGKNPNLVFADADFDAALGFALDASFLHSGQVCSAGSRLLVQDTLHDRFVEALAERAAAIRLGDGLDPATESGPLSSAEHRDKVEAYFAIAREDGARLVTGGRRPDDPALARGFFLQPTVYADCERSMRIVQEEVFGPVVTVERFHDEDEAVALANDTRYGLAGGVWTSEASRAQRVANRLRHGTVWINDFHPYLPQAEWGGFGRSGVGRELGPTGLREYQEAKHIYQNLHPAPSGWFKG
ncbi:MULTISPECIES: aldehyde dehydrogenase family protein [Streptomyces]|uniref:Glycine betaine aldehyde dehydrogenase n=1 Tax=Streptomyces albus (strain ATCC 21838 / DSM 41398 / FERM P-419 / JCM 4703 / NBRC 107858) TaxID=1081613 RepID=A0A0B5ELL1_STRA4|nr:aldehyde dehydrogenase family protein [Streptomyces sp. SCSIO ZS0520]AJE82419.1 glycine betaine aldehyde dehydrogenase [Streptomyces albus]AOU76733.1 glycine betaine aldehyde dehydrogenase [Streptomyces albus]AYN32513.1 betaine-aldehyde dehydrogenase [Streptomyces albus]